MRRRWRGSQGAEPFHRIEDQIRGVLARTAHQASCMPMTDKYWPCSRRGTASRRFQLFEEPHYDHAHHLLLHSSRLSVSIGARMVCGMHVNPHVTARTVAPRAASRSASQTRPSAPARSARRASPRSAPGQTTTRAVSDPSAARAALTDSSKACRPFHLRHTARLRPAGSPASRRVRRSGTGVRTGRR